MSQFFTNLSFAWVDIAVLLLLGFGVSQGRKRGLSGEILDVVKWILIVAAGGLTYRPLSGILRQYLPSLSPLASYILVYLTVVAVLALAFSSIKHAVGEKLAKSEAFGSAEYYVGMVLGAVRFACIALVAMSLVHARLYTPAEVKAREKAQEDSFGDIRFFRLYKLQSDIFQDSLVGRGVEHFLGGFLIEATAPGGGAAPSESPANKRERRLNEILDR